MRSVAKIAIGTALAILVVVALIVLGGSVALGGGGEVTPAESVSDAAPTQAASAAADDARAEDPDPYSANADTYRQPTMKRRQATTTEPGPA